MNRVRGTIVVVMLAGVMLGGALPYGPVFAAEPGESEFRAAQKNESTKNYQGAISHYSGIVSKYGKSLYAGEAQFRMAYLYDEKIHDVKKAIEHYRKYLDEFNGRHSRRAEVRIKALAPYRDVDQKKYSRYLAILDSYKGLTKEKTIKEMEQFIAENRDLSILDEAIIWLANEYRGFKRTPDKHNTVQNLDRAIELFKRVVKDYPGRTSRIVALKNLGDCYRMKGDHSLARDYYERTIEEGGDYGRRLVGQYMLMTTMTLYRKYALIAAIIAMPLLLFGLVRVVPVREFSMQGFKRGLFYSLFFLPFALFITIATFVLTDTTKSNITGKEPFLVLALMLSALAGIIFSSMVLEADREEKVNTGLYLALLFVFFLCLNYCIFYMAGLLTIVERLIV